MYIGSNEPSRWVFQKLLHNRINNILHAGLLVNGTSYAKIHEISNDANY